MPLGVRPLRLRGPDGAHPQADPDLVVRDVDGLLEGEHDVGAVEEDVEPGEGLGLGLSRVLHRHDDGVVGDGPALRQVDLVLGRQREGVDRAVAPSAGVGATTLRASQSEEPSLPRRRLGSHHVVRDRRRVGDRTHIVHHRHRLVGLPFSARGPARGCFAGHERLDVGDVPPPLGPPSRGDAHADRHGARITRVHRVHQSGIGPVEADGGEREGLPQRMLCTGRGNPTPTLDRPGRAHFHEFVGETGSGPGVPFQRRAEHARAVADADDPALPEGGHERTEDGSERPFVGEGDRALDGRGQGRSPRSGSVLVDFYLIGQQARSAAHRTGVGLPPLRGARRRPRGPTRPAV